MVIEEKKKKKSISLYLHLFSLQCRLLLQPDVQCLKIQCSQLRGKMARFFLISGDVTAFVP